MPRRPTLPDLRSPKEKRIDEWVSAELARTRKERREAAKAGQLPLVYPQGNPWPAPGEGLKRGMKPDPLRELCRHGLTTLLTDREHREFKRQHRRLGRRWTVSTVLRVMICAYLEAHRDPAIEEKPFGLDLKALCWRSLRCTRE